NPSHLGSYCQPRSSGKSSAERASMGWISSGSPNARSLDARLAITLSSSRIWQEVKAAPAAARRIIFRNFCRLAAPIPPVDGLSTAMPNRRRRFQGSPLSDCPSLELSRVCAHKSPAGGACQHHLVDINTVKRSNLIELSKCGPVSVGYIARARNCCCLPCLPEVDGRVIDPVAFATTNANSAAVIDRSVPLTGTRMRRSASFSGRRPRDVMISVVPAKAEIIDASLSA
ncbi:hypothetical protein Rleg9DRAFT_4985, partial [Rhizobium leguminosarum bv. trifolii WSM597]